MSSDLPPPSPPSGDVTPEPDDGRRRRRLTWIVIAGVVALAVAGLIAVILVNDDSSDSVTSATDPSLPASTSAPAPSVEPATTPPPESTAAATVPPTEPAVATTEPATTAATTPPATDPAPPDTRPIAAIDGNGDAVVLRPGGAPVIVLYDGVDPDDPPPEEGPVTFVDGVAVVPDLTVAFVGDCCEPVPGVLLRAIPGQLATFDSFVGYGSAPALDPAGTRVAVASYYSLAVYDVAGELVATSDEFDDLNQPHSVAWIDANRLVAVGLRDDGYTLGVYTVTGDVITTDEVVVIAPTDASQTRSPAVAGADPTRVLVNGLAGTTLQAYDVGTLAPLPAADVELPAPALAAWVDEGVLWVDEQRTLHVDDSVLAGEFTWARR